jgi:carboxymethylenebutenolidase
MKDQTTTQGMEPVPMRELMGERDVNRRMFVVSSLAAGFAASVLPVSAQTITTSADGLTVGEVKIPASGGSLPAYRAKPAQGGPFPVVLVIQEIFGVHEWVRDMCRRLAHQGYYAIATELYARQGDASKVPDVPTLMKTIVANVPDAQVMGDLDATAVFAQTDGGNAARLGVIGFCWGGRAVMMYASHNPRLKAAIACYGFPNKAFHEGDRMPQDLVAANKTPTLGIFGSADQGIPADAIKAYFDALKNAGNTGSEYEIYQGAQHGFLADYRPSYDKASAEKAWTRITGWFKAKL